MPPEAASTRERILDVASRLFYEQGYHATGVATILREADVNSGSLYHFFPSKEELLIGVLERYAAGLEPIVLQPPERSTRDPIERIFTLLAWYRGNLELTGCRGGCPIGNLALELSDDHPPVRKLIDLNFRNWAKGIQRWLDEGAEQLPGDVDREQLSRFVLTVMEGGIMQSRAAGELSPFDDSVAQLREYVDRLKAAARRERRNKTKPASGRRKAATRRR